MSIVGAEPTGEHVSGPVTAGRHTNGGDGVVLVTGATGLIGRGVLAELTRRGVPVRAMSRTPSRDLSRPGVHPVAADLDDPVGWDATLRGVEAIFLYPRGDTAGFLARARDAGVRHVVTLSSGTVSRREREPSPGAARHAAIEAAVEASGLTWAHLRPATFAANTLNWASDIRRDATVRLACPDARFPVIHEADVAAVAVTDLLAPEPGAVREITGPEQVSQRDQVRTLSAALGRTLRVEEIDRRQAADRLRAGGIPDWLATTALDHMARSVREPDPVTPDVARVTGRPAASYARWADDHRGDFAARPAGAGEPRLTTGSVDTTPGSRR